MKLKNIHGVNIIGVDHKIIKFLLVGILNTALGYSLYALFIFGGLSFPLAVLLSTVFGVLFNYRTIGKIVFSHNDYSRLSYFFLVYFLIYILNILGLWFFEQIGLENKYLAGALLLAPLAIISFVLNKKFVFN